MTNGPRFEDVVGARSRIAGRVFATPVLTSDALDARAGASLFLKAENLQRIGAFKARGAMNAVLSLPEERRGRDLVTYSSGNHGQAVALAALELGLRATIVMPEDAPRVKVDAVVAMGGEVRFAGTTSDERMRLALEIASSTGAVVIPPFDDAAIVAGQGTATLELLEACRDRGAPLDAVLVPVGGGGLLAGACIAASGFEPRPRIVAVEPENADAFAKSFQKGERVRVEMKPTLADGLRPVRVGELTFEIARAHVAAAVTVTEEEIGDAVRSLLFGAKVLAEPSGATALAAALSRKIPFEAKRVGVVLSGGNVEPHVLVELLREG